MRLATIIPFVFITTSLFSQTTIKSGPMLGYAEMRETLIWVQFEKTVEAQIKYWPLGSRDTLVSETLTSNSESAFVLKFVIGNLEPGTNYNYIIDAKNEQKIEKVFSFKTQVLWQHRTEPPSLKFALGSCTYINELEYDRPGNPYGGDYDIFETINRMNPDLMLWLGDNIYLRESDYNSRSGILHRYTHTRSTPEMQNLLANCNNYAIWDDHDFGPNDADGSFVHKDLTLDAFKLFWGNNGYGVDGKPGITNQFTYGDVDFFLLDNRYNRTPQFDKLEKQILGEDQINWLVAALKSSKASFKLVAVGGQVLNSSAIFENHEVFKKEKETLISKLKAENIEGVVFLTGDRHHTELSKYVDSDGFTLYDLTVSPLTSSPTKFNDEANKFRVKDTKIHERNYAIIDVIGPLENRTLEIAIFNKMGEMLWNNRININDF
jgi:alkaline phosphatase D